MPVNVARLRYWFAGTAIALVAIVVAFYIYGQAHWGNAITAPKQKLEINVQQSTNTFSLSKSEGGHTLFTVRAAKATQFKDTGRAILHDVNIVIYGRESNRFDQIYGSDFEFDPQSGNVIAKGVVHIDLEADSGGISHPDQAPPQELKNPIHLMTSGLVFNQKTGDAVTKERIEFRIPQANGWAVGATYDSKNSQLLLDSDVHLSNTGANATNIVARRGLITKTPRRAVLESAQIETADSTMRTQELTVFMHEDNSVDHVVASRGVEAVTRGPNPVQAHATDAVFYLHGKDNSLQRANLTGGATFQTVGANVMSGSADSIGMDFRGRNLLDHVHAQGHARLLKPADAKSDNAQDVQLDADALDMWLNAGRELNRAETSGQAAITLTPMSGGQGRAAPPSAVAVRNARQTANSGPTVITAAKFYGSFGAHNQLTSLIGYPNAKVVSPPGRVSTSGRIEVAFTPTGGIAGIVQRENFEYHERLANGTDRAAWAQSANYSPQSETLVLNGAPRVTEGGMTIAARTLNIDRRTGDAAAEGDVKSTYSDLKPQPGGGMLASGEPIHVTSRSMTAQRSSGVAHYAGDARLWQGANIIEGGTIDFDRNRRTVTAKAAAARSSSQQRVTTVLTQQSKQGKQAPVNITSASFVYSDLERIAHYEGGVVAHSAEGTLTAHKADVYLKPAQPGAASHGDPGAAGPQASQVDHIVAEGSVRLQQPTRIARGERLVYTADSGTYVLTGGPPSISDAEHGTVQGASLTFYNRDDRVLVEGGQSGRTVTETRVSK